MTRNPKTTGEVEHLERVKALWDRLGDVPINENEKIDTDFLHFSEGTHREDIWHWFESSLSVSVVYLMRGEIPPIVGTSGLSASALRTAQKHVESIDKSYKT